MRFYWDIARAAKNASIGWEMIIVLCMQNAQTLRVQLQAIVNNTVQWWHYTHHDWMYCSNKRNNDMLGVYRSSSLFRLLVFKVIRNKETKTYFKMRMFQNNTLEFPLHWILDRCCNYFEIFLKGNKCIKKLIVICAIVPHCWLSMERGKGWKVRMLVLEFMDK